MADFSLSLNRALFPWRSVGLRTLLYDEETISGLRSIARSVPSVNKTEVSSESRAIPSQSQSATSVQGFSEHTRPQESVHQLTARMQHSEARSASKNIPQAGSQIRILSPEQWPCSWNECWDKLIRNAPKIIWTYPELTDDLTGNALPEQITLRRSAFQKMFRDLTLPADKHHAFWPMAPLRKEEAVPYTDADFFASGMERLRPELIIFLCDTTPKSLHIPQLQSKLPIIHHGIRYFRVYNVAEFAADVLDNTNRHRGLIRFIQNFFHSPTA